MVQLCHIYYTFLKGIANEDHGVLFLGMGIRKKPQAFRHTFPPCSIPGKTLWFDNSINSPK